MTRMTAILWTVGLVLPVMIAAGGEHPDAEAAVKAMLTDLRRAAAEADGERYFGHLAPDAVILGTAGDERFTPETLRALVEPHFAQGTGWETVATEQNVYLSEDGTLAWFDERLQRANLSEMRGSGVARLTDDGWKVVHYNTSFPIPNELAVKLKGLIERLPAEE